MKEANGLRALVSTQNLMILGLFMILIGNMFHLVILKIKVDEFVTHVGALLLIVGTIHWLFDVDSRNELLKEFSRHLSSEVHKELKDFKNQIEHQLNTFNQVTEFGIADTIPDSKLIGSHESMHALRSAEHMIIGLHYSDGTVNRFGDMIRSRIKDGKTTSILYVSPDGISKSYLENSLGRSVRLEERVEGLLGMINRLEGGDLVKAIPHDRVLRYSFIYCEHFSWLIFSTSSANYFSSVPGILVRSNSPFFNLIKQDVAALGVTV